MQELAWLIANDLDLEGAKLNQFFRVPFLELQYIGLPAKLRYSKQHEVISKSITESTRVKLLK